MKQTFTDSGDHIVIRNEDGGIICVKKLSADIDFMDFPTSTDPTSYCTGGQYNDIKIQPTCNDNDIVITLEDGMHMHMLKLYIDRNDLHFIAKQIVKHYKPEGE